MHGQLKRVLVSNDLCYMGVIFSDDTVHCQGQNQLEPCRRLLRFHQLEAFWLTVLLVHEFKNLLVSLVVWLTRASITSLCCFWRTMLIKCYTV